MKQLKEMPYMDSSILVTFIYFQTYEIWIYTFVHINHLFKLGHFTDQATCLYSFGTGIHAFSQYRKVWKKIGAAWRLQQPRHGSLSPRSKSVLLGNQAFGKPNAPPQKNKRLEPRIGKRGENRKFQLLVFRGLCAVARPKLGIP